MNESADKLDDERVALLRRIDALEAIEPLTGDALLERENSLKLLLMAYLPVIRRALAGIALPETQPLTGDTPRTDAALKKALEIAGAAKDASAKTMLTAFLTSIKVDMVQLECELAETHAAWDETSAALNAEVDRRIKAESALSAIGPSSAPVAWLYQLGKPGKRVTFASVDPNDPTEWPKEQWTNGYKVSPLYTAPVSTTQPLMVGAVPQWPKGKLVGRMGEMAPKGDMNLLVCLQDDGDVVVECWEVRHGRGDRAQVEFCTVGAGGGRSPRTRAALIALMVAIEADNAESPDRAFPPNLPSAVQSATGERKT